MKKLLWAVLALLLFTGCAKPAEKPPVEIGEPLTVLTLDLACPYGAVYCIEDDGFLYEKKAEERCYPASLTKLITAITVLEYLNPDETVTVGEEINRIAPGSSRCYITVGQRLTVKTLLYGLLLPSGNDAAYTLAVAAARKEANNSSLPIGDAVTHFALLMNATAERLEMSSSHFVTPDGIHNDNHYSTVKDLAKAAAHFLSIPLLKEIAGTVSVEVTMSGGATVTWTNSNALINPSSAYYRQAAFGLKTGSTTKAGKCIIAGFAEKGKTYLALVLGCDSDSVRFESAIAMMDAVARIQ